MIKIKTLLLNHSKLSAMIHLFYRSETGDSRVKELKIILINIFAFIILIINSSVNFGVLFFLFLKVLFKQLSLVSSVFKSFSANSKVRKTITQKNGNKNMKTTAVPQSHRKVM